MLCGCPSWNSIVNRSYPECEPVRTASTYAESGGCWPAKLVADAHTKGWLEAVGGELGLGVGPGDCEAAGVGLDPTTGPTVFAGRLSGFATNRTPITTTAIAAAATPATQNGPRSSGTC